jgi:hypothetical protein
MRLRNLLATGSVAAWLLCGMTSAHAITGDYLEVRSCDVFTGPCFANAEMGLTGKEGILVWTIREGRWNGVELNGLSVIAVVRTRETMGDTSFRPAGCSGGVCRRQGWRLGFRSGRGAYIFHRKHHWCL